MSAWVGAPVVIAVLAVSVGLVLLLLALRRLALRAESLLGILESELGPLVGRVNALTDDLDLLVRGANREVERLGTVTAEVHDVAEGIGRIVSALVGMSRAGQLVSVAVGLKKGVDVFVDRFWRGQGDHHG
jgi:uncharacterized protein YoxC